MIRDEPKPLPECALCSTPTVRAIHRRNGGMCTPCRREYESRAPEQTQIPLVTSAPKPTPPDLSNVVVLDTRRKR